MSEEKNCAESAKVDFVDFDEIDELIRQGTELVDTVYRELNLSRAGSNRRTIATSGISSSVNCRKHTSANSTGSSSTVRTRRNSTASARSLSPISTSDTTTANSVQPIDSARTIRSSTRTARRSAVEVSPVYDSQFELQQIVESVLPFKEETENDNDNAIEAANRFCDSVDENLKAIGLLEIDSPIKDNFKLTERSKLQKAKDQIPKQRSYNLVNSPSASTSSASSRNSVTSSTPKSNYTMDNPNDDLSQSNDIIFVRTTAATVIDLCTPPARSRRSLNVMANAIINENATAINLTNNTSRNSIQRGRRRNAATARPTNTTSTERSFIPAVTNTSRVRSNEIRSIQAGLADSEVVANAIDTIDLEISPKKVRRIEPKVSLDRSSDDESYKCPVCLESVRSRQPTSTKCGHVFCNGCIVVALGNNKKCPICNTKLTMKQLSRLYM